MNDIDIPNENELNMILQAFAESRESDDDIGKLVAYCCWQRRDIGFTEDEIQDDVCTMITSYIVTGLVSKGMVDVDFSNPQLTYSLTDVGKEYVENSF